jgi:hypothetical protein
MSAHYEGGLAWFWNGLSHVSKLCQPRWDVYFGGATWLVNLITAIGSPGHPQMMGIR